MSFPVAFRSAVFYVVACTPCAKVRHRHKAKEQAKKERVEKAKLETEQPDLYCHPSPFNTNPYWQEEIDIGPSLPKKSASKNSSQRGLTSSGRDSTVLSISEHTTVGDSRTNFGDSTMAIPLEERLSDDWNTRRGYQREDEELWGQWPGHKIMDAFSKARGSAGRLIESTLGIEKEVTDEERREFYFSPKNPPVNDYHPPVVSSKPPHRDARKWMLQPPPSAKVMEGKVPVGRAVSSGSRSSGRTLVGDEQLGRMMQEKMVQEKLKKEPVPTEAELIESLFRTRSSMSAGNTRGRSLSFDGSEDSFDNPFDRRRKSRLRTMAGPSGTSDDQDEEPTSAISQTISHTSASGHAAQRPKLQTIPSDGGEGSSRTLSKKSKRARHSFMTGSPVGDDSD